MPCLPSNRPPWLVETILRNRGGVKMDRLSTARATHQTYQSNTFTSVMLATGWAVLIIIGLAVNAMGAQTEADDSVDDPQVDDVTLTKLLDVARDELEAAELADKEIRLRLRIVEDVATVKAYFPHAYRGRPEMRNPKFWTQNDEGSYVPRRKPSEAIKDLWHTTSGIRCHKLSSIVLLKGLVDVADEEQLAALNDMLRGRVIPNDLPEEGIGTLYDQPEPREGDIFQDDEFLPGDNVWFYNPYFEQLSEKLQSRYRGQEGHHVFYIGGGKVMDMYGREAIAIDDFRETFLEWGSVTTVAEEEDLEPKAEDFQIKGVRRAIPDAPRSE
jgi:hypothetical protein